MTHIIIDGYNLIRQIPGLAAYEKRSLESARKRLILELNTYARVKKHHITLVFDGRGGLGEYAAPYRDGSIDVVFSRAGDDADTVIKRYISELGARIVVVTSDRELALLATKAGSGHVWSEGFYQRLLRATTGDVNVFTKDVDVNSINRSRRTGTAKKGPSKKLPKKARRNQNRTRSL